MLSVMISSLGVRKKGAMLLTEALFFDTDCLSAFLWVGNESLLPQLYPGKIVIPKPVYTELDRPSIPHLKARVDALVAANLVTIQEIAVGAEEYETYYQLTEEPAQGHKIIGLGEAASIALAKQYGGIVASNNFRDISTYIEEFSLKYTTTADILVDAYERGFITESQGNTIWSNMLSKRRRIGGASFSDYLKSKSS